MGRQTEQQRARQQNPETYTAGVAADSVQVEFARTKRPGPEGAA